jgi:hypothetical protein
VGEVSKKSPDSPMPLVRNEGYMPLVRNYKIIPTFKRLHPITITRKVEFAQRNYKIATQNKPTTRG